MKNRPIVQWQFERGDRHLMCMVQAPPLTSSYEVAVVPLWDVGCSAVEAFDNPGQALHRHAAIAAGLREDGWTLAAYTA